MVDAEAATTDRVLRSGPLHPNLGEPMPVAVSSPSRREQLYNVSL